MLARIENLATRTLDVLLHRLVIDRLPPHTLFWLQYAARLRPLIVGETALDIGCGVGSRVPFDSARWFGTDLFLPALRVGRARSHYSGLVCADLLTQPGALRSQSVDTVTALDFVEHFDKPDAVRVLETLERVARKRVVLLTPNGYLSQEESILKGNPWMEHRCGWTVEELRGRGYQVIGWSGWKGFAGPGGYIRRRLDALFQILMTLSQPFVEHRPEHAFHLLCWKEISDGQTHRAPLSGGASEL